MNVKNVDELKEYLQKKQIIIVGAGYTGKRFFNALCINNLEQNVLCFSTTNGNDIKKLYEIPVFPLTELEIQSSVLFCVAVHESIKDDVINNLIKNEIKKFIWVTPFLYDLMLGTPIEKNVKVPIKRIWNAVNVTYSMAIRYLAIEQYYGIRNNGYEIYKNCISCFSNQKTAESRLESFISMIINWDANGYDENKPSLLLEDCTPIDGMHRIALASYKEQDYIKANIYSSKDIDLEIHKKEAILTNDRAIELGLSRSDIYLLEEINNRIRLKYE